MGVCEGERRRVGQHPARERDAAGDRAAAVGTRCHAQLDRVFHGAAFRRSDDVLYCFCPIPSATRERLIVSLTPQTGMTAVHPVYVSQTTENADPFRYSETGEVAKQ